MYLMTMHNGVSRLCNYKGSQKNLFCRSVHFLFSLSYAVLNICLFLPHISHFFFLYLLQSPFLSFFTMFSIFYGLILSDTATNILYTQERKNAEGSTPSNPSVQGLLTSSMVDKNNNPREFPKTGRSYSSRAKSSAQQSQ